MSEDQKPSKPSPARPGPTPASENPGLRGQKRRPEAPRRDRGRKRKRDRGPDRTSAPTPVREAMDERSLEPTSLSEFPERAFETEGGEEWLVRRTGLSQIGHGRGAAGTMMHLSFSRADDPGTVSCEVVTPSRSLDDLSEAQLVGLLADATEPPPADNRGAGEVGEARGRRPRPGAGA